MTREESAAATIAMLTRCVKYHNRSLPEPPVIYGSTESVRATGSSEYTAPIEDTGIAGVYKDRQDSEIELPAEPE